MAEPVAIWKQLAVLALLAGGAVWAWQSGQAERLALSVGAVRDGAAAARAPAPVPVIVAPVGTARDDVRLEVVGTGRARRSVTLRSEAEGKIVEMALAANARFSEGEVLLRLDDMAARLALSLAETRRDEAGRVRERLRRLAGSGTASATRLDEVETAAEVARLEVLQAEEALEDRVLRAPFDGVSGLPAVEPGAWIDSDVAIATFDDRSEILVEFDLPEAALARIRPGLRVSARTAAFDDRRLDGRVTAIDSRIDAASRSARIRVAIPNADDRLRPGASFVIELDLPGPEVPSVPELALQFGQEGLHVWAVRDGRAERVAVRLVRRRAGQVLVEGALGPADRVVVEGTQRLRAGRAVAVTGERRRP